MGKFDSKRVLDIGRGGNTRHNIAYLKNNGAYLIVADKCPQDQNPYRDLADEVVELDIDDADKVIAYCKQNEIDAVVTNGTEESCEQARILNEGIGNTYCHTKEQWQTFVKKDNFRKLCIEHGIDVPITFFAGEYTSITNEIKAEIVFPVIVKPVDCAGGEGISVVFEKAKLDKAILFAGKHAASSKIIIEEYIVGKEVVFTYVVQNGTYKLTASADKYVYKDKRNLTVVPDLYIYPCEDHDLFESNGNQKVLEMLKSQGLDNCTIFFQTIEKDHTFFFFESGLRMEGTRTPLITECFTGQNSGHFYYDYLLKTKTNYDILKDDPKLCGHSLALYVIHLRKGKIKRIEGLDEIQGNKKILRKTIVRGVGSVVGSSPLDSCLGAFSIEGSNRQELVNQIAFIKKHLKVKNIFHINMILDSFDESILL